MRTAYDHEAKRAAGIDFTIDRRGGWHFHGESNPGPIAREALVRLFAEKGLKFDQGGYTLTSPQESYLVDVEDVPFVIEACDINDPGPFQRIVLTTNLGQVHELNQERPLFLKDTPLAAEKLPYVETGSRLLARLNRSVRETLIHEALDALSGGPPSGSILTIRSCGFDHPLAEWPATAEGEPE